MPGNIQMPFNTALHSEFQWHADTHMEDSTFHTHEHTFQSPVDEGNTHHMHSSLYSHAHHINHHTVLSHTALSCDQLQSHHIVTLITSITTQFCLTLHYHVINCNLIDIGDEKGGWLLCFLIFEKYIFTFEFWWVSLTWYVGDRITWWKWNYVKKCDFTPIATGLQWSKAEIHCLSWRLQGTFQAFPLCRAKFGKRHHLDRKATQLCVWERMGLVGGFESDTESVQWVPC